VLTQDQGKWHHSGVPTDTPVGFRKSWTITGYLLALATALFVGRIIYEETLLTWTNGPQMVGFALMHGAAPYILIAGLIGLLGGTLWLIVSIGLLFRRRFRISLTDWVPICLLPLFVLLLFIPYETWEELMVDAMGPGTHGSEFLIQAAAQGKQRFVTHLLRGGYDINYENSGGTTPLSGAAVEGRVEMIVFLVSMRADVNRHDHLTGETPLIGASEMGQFEAVQTLLKNGADPCAANNKGETAAAMAKNYAHNEIAEYLSSRFRCQ
jgi:Ankyrin repeats (3 copies)